MSAEKFPGEPMEKSRPKNSTIKPPSTLSVSSTKIQGATAPLPPLPTPWYSTKTFTVLLSQVKFIL